MKILSASILFLIVVCNAATSKLENALRSELLKKIQDGNRSLVLPDHKVVGGWSATSGLVPYQAALKIFSYQGEFNCGGSLITRRHVLSAAHCLINMMAALVTLGSSNRETMFGPGIKTFLVDGENFVIHPDYDDNDLHNDIAVLRLPGSIIPSFTIRPISLPTDKMTDVNYFAGKQAAISGFGKTSDNSWDYGSEKLMMANVDITEISVCQEYWKKEVTVTESQICTSFSGSSTCQGDSGGPLAVTISKKPYLVGITSYGETRCLKSAPSVYTNVAAYLAWIKSVVNLK